MKTLARSMIMYQHVFMGTHCLHYLHWYDWLIIGWLFRMSIATFHGNTIWNLFTYLTNWLLIITAAYFHCNVFKYKYFYVARNITCKHHIDGPKRVSNPELLLYSLRHSQRVASSGDNNNNNNNDNANDK